MEIENYAVVFPGQGSQYVGMGKEIIERYSIAKKIFEYAEDITGLPLRQYCINGPNHLLQETQITQPCLFTTTVAILETVKSLMDMEPVYVCGHSAGEYAALYAAGVLTFKDALNLTVKRGQFMSETIEGGMLAIKGASQDEIMELCREAARSDGCLVPANWNSPDQTVISGDLESVDNALTLSFEKGIQVVPLPVSGAFHSPLMHHAASELFKHLKEVTFNQHKVPIISNVTGRPVEEHKNWPRLLKEQMVSPVKWLHSIQYLYDQGIHTFIEIGPGNVLSRLIKKTVHDVTTINIENPSSLCPTFQSFHLNT